MTVNFENGLKFFLFLGYIKPAGGDLQSSPLNQGFIIPHNNHR